MARWKTGRWAWALAVIVVLYGIVQHQPATSANEGTAKASGTVQFEGTPPAGKKASLGADPNCKSAHPEGLVMEEVAVNENGTLRDVFVYVKEGLEGQTFAAPTEPALLDQSTCVYHPHIVGLQVGQPLEVHNADPTIHNVRAKPAVNQAFNFAQPKQDMRTTKTFDKPEIMIQLGCNIHPWMRSYVGVVDNPFFAVTGEDGSFELAGLPAGTYTIEAWQEVYGTQTQTVTVADGETASVTFTFKAE